MKLFKQSDWKVVLAVLVLAGVGAAVYDGYAPTNKTVTAEIYDGSSLNKSIALSAGEASSFSLPQCPAVTFELDGEGRIRFLSSDCPDQICVRAGWQYLAGQSAACLPNQLIIKLVAKQQAVNVPELIA